MTREPTLMKPAWAGAADMQAKSAQAMAPRLRMVRIVMTDLSYGTAVWKGLSATAVDESRKKWQEGAFSLFARDVRGYFVKSSRDAPMANLLTRSGVVNTTVGA